MKKVIGVILIALWIAAAFCLLILLDTVFASEDIFGAYKVRCTCYLPTGNKTASGVYPYEGIIAADKSHLGQIAALYTEEGALIGFFECKDTGGHSGLKDGSRIDVYRESRESLNKWVKDYGDYVYIQWIDGIG